MTLAIAVLALATIFALHRFADKGFKQAEKMMKTNADQELQDLQIAS